MADASIQVIDHVSPMLRGMVRQIRDYGPPLRLAGQYMFRETVRQFESEGVRAGTPWKPLSKATLKRRRKGSSAILQDTGRLRRSVTGSSADGAIYEMGETSLRIGTNLVYAAIHQHGGDISMVSRAGNALLRRTKSGGFRFTKVRKGTVRSLSRALDREMDARDQYGSEADVGFAVAQGLMSQGKGRSILRAMGAYSRRWKSVRWAGGKPFVIHIPARPFLVVTDTNREEIGRIFLRHAMKG